MVGGRDALPQRVNVADLVESSTPVSRDDVVGRVLVDVVVESEGGVEVGGTLGDQATGPQVSGDRCQVSVMGSPATATRTTWAAATPWSPA